MGTTTERFPRTDVFFWGNVMELHGVIFRVEVMADIFLPSFSVLLLRKNVVEPTMQ